MDFYFDKNAKYYFLDDITVELVKSEKFLHIYPYLSKIKNYLIDDTEWEEIKQPWFFHFTDLFFTINFHNLRALKKKKWMRCYFDVLVVGEIYNKKEKDMMARLLGALIRRGQNIVYVEPEPYLSDWIKEQNYKKITIINISNELSRYDLWVIKKLAGIRAIKDSQILHRIMSNKRISIRDDFFVHMKRIARLSLLGREFATNLKFGTVIVRNHHTPLSSSFIGGSLEKNVPTIAFQHGVLSYPSFTHIPVVSSKFVCNGSVSANLYQMLDQNIANMAEKKPICNKIILGGGHLWIRLLKFHPITIKKHFL